MGGKRRMKIGVDGSAFIYPLTGIGTYVFQLLDAWARQSPDDEFIVYLPTDPIYRLPYDNIRYKKPCCLGWGYRLNGVRMFYWYHIWMPVMMKRDKLDWFWEGHGMGPLIAPVSMILSVHDFVYLRNPETMQRSDRYNRMLRQPHAIRSARKVVCVSQATADEMRYLYHRTADAIIRPSADPIFTIQTAEAIRSLKARLGLPEQYHLVVGTLEPRKNLLLFLTCYLEVYTGKERAIPLVIVGADGWSDSALSLKIAEGKASELVIRLGYVPKEDLPPLYAGARAFFMPSLYEGFGIPLLEARKCGAPVVCSDIPAHHESAGENAYFHTADRAGILAMLHAVSRDDWDPSVGSEDGLQWDAELGAANMAALLRDPEGEC